MPHGKCQTQYLNQPHIVKPMEEIYADLDAYTFELFDGDPEIEQRCDFTAVLPPLRYDGQFVKGFFFSRSVDYLHRQMPVLADLFISAAYTMWSAYPWSRKADAYLTAYENPERDAWFRHANPDRGGKSHIPLQDSDFTHEYLMASAPGRDRDIDVLCVSRLERGKNLPLLAQALKIYRAKHPRKPIRMTLVAGQKGVFHGEGISPHEQAQLGAIQEILGRPEDYIDFVEHADHYREMPAYYGRARVVVLGSLLEGKNRTLNEAMSCNTPVVCFQEFNQFARQGAPAFPEGAGQQCAFAPESLADALHSIVEGPAHFQPRYEYLRVNGRRNFFRKCLDAVSYYAETLPEYAAGLPDENLWLDLAMQDNYGVSLFEFLYGKRRDLSVARGFSRISRVVAQYREAVRL